MNRILTSKPWHIFMAVEGIPSVLFYLLVSKLQVEYFLPFLLVFFLPCGVWFYVVGANLFIISGRFSSQKIIKFKATMIFMLLAWIIFSLLTVGETTLSDGYRTLFILATFCIALGPIFALMQVAQALTSAQGQPADKFKEYGGNFLTLWLLPFSCFWYLQKETMEIFLKQSPDKDQTVQEISPAH